MRKLACLLLVAGALVATVRPARASHVDLAAPVTATAAAASAPYALLAHARTLASDVWSWLSPDDAEVAILLLTGVAYGTQVVDGTWWEKGHRVYFRDPPPDAKLHVAHGEWRGRTIHNTLRSTLTKGRWGVRVDLGTRLVIGDWTPSPDDTRGPRRAVHNGQGARVLLGWEGTWIGGWLGVSRYFDSRDNDEAVALTGWGETWPSAALRLGHRWLAVQVRLADGGESGESFGEGTVGAVGHVPIGGGRLRWSLDFFAFSTTDRSFTLAWEGTRLRLVGSARDIRYREDDPAYPTQALDYRQVTIGLGGRM